MRTPQMLARSYGPFFIVWLALAGESRFDGTWRGTYNSQPNSTRTGGSYPKIQNEFMLRLHEKAGLITGDFQVLRPSPGRVQPVMDGKRFGDRACFDLTAGGDDMRWCVLVSGKKLTGAWSRGPEGGPMLRGAGAGARLFKIAAHKSDSGKPRN